MHDLWGGKWIIVNYCLIPKVVIFIYKSYTWILPLSKLVASCMHLYMCYYIQVRYLESKWCILKCYLSLLKGICSRLAASVHCLASATQHHPCAEASPFSGTCWGSSAPDVWIPIPGTPWLVLTSPPLTPSSLHSWHWRKYTKHACFPHSTYQGNHAWKVTQKRHKNENLPI